MTKMSNIISWAVATNWPRLHKPDDLIRCKVLEENEIACYKGYQIRMQSRGGWQNLAVLFRVLVALLAAREREREYIDLFLPLSLYSWLYSKATVFATEKAANQELEMLPTSYISQCRTRLWLRRCIESVA